MEFTYLGLNKGIVTSKVTGNSMLEYMDANQHTTFTIPTTILTKLLVELIEVGKFSEFVAYDGFKVSELHGALKFTNPQNMSFSLDSLQSNKLKKHIVTFWCKIRYGSKPKPNLLPYQHRAL